MELTEFVDGLDVGEYDIKESEIGFWIRYIMLLTSFSLCLFNFCLSLKNLVCMLPPMENFPTPTSIKLGDHSMCFYSTWHLMRTFFFCFVPVNLLPHTHIHITFTLLTLSCEGKGHACLTYHHIPST